MSTVSKSELRRFGLTVGGAFVLLGAVSWYRGHEIPPRVLWTAGGLLIVPGLLVPSLLGPVHRGWMAFAMALGHFNTRVILTALFYVVLTPIGLVMRLFKDPLNRSMKPAGGSDWIRREPQPVDAASYERQF